MNRQRLFLLLSLDEFKFYESWDDNWEWLLWNRYVSVESLEAVPALTVKGKQTIAAAIQATEKP